jgi:hypothetical protein
MSETLDVITLPVSYGEAFDKLSILDIKLDKIKDERVNDVLKEYNMIKNQLNNLMSFNVQFHYNILKKINESIWNKQDIFRMTNVIDVKNKLCIDIIEENDRRFRIKNKINNILNSSLKEQKGYARKKAFILTHLGLGDHITCIGMVRYYATIYDELYIVCKHKFVENLRLFYKDDPTIHFYCVDNNIGNTIEGFSKESNAKYMFNGEIYDLITVGAYGPVHTYSIGAIPFCFYKDIQLDYGIFWEYSHMIDTHESKELYNLIKDIDYIIIQNATSEGIAFPIEQIERHFHIDRNKTLILNIEQNVYTQDHHYYKLAEQFVMKPILFYKDTIINAQQVHTTDSCLFCFAMVLPIETEECFIYPRSYYPYAYKYIFTEQYKFNPQKTRQFQQPF